MGVQEWFESLRKWIDGEEDLDDEGQAKPRSKWDDFLVSVAREIEACMQREMFTPPGGPTYVPREYIVFLHPDDDSEWQGEKREGLERGLRHVLTERATELAGSNEFQTRTLAIELRVDPGLEKGKFRVQHVWDTEAQKTMVKPRKRAEERPTAAVADDEATIVRPRKQGEPSFLVSVRRTNAGGEAPPPNIVPFYKDQITIGRGSRQVDVDLKLEGDLEISRQHATLEKKPDASFAISCSGANPILLGDGNEVSSGNSAPVKAGEKISICSYELVVETSEI
ncbi:MAG TPA: FhaA domain-containing protein [Blastocatellia bacterium]|nr:FhaA domain-containing protein [Blastocatellia bacterium]